MLKLRKVEIVGFKSFCERTVVTFSGTGTTCIVGPNGCGKSNVVDAISWVLGEQSHKSLRAERMADCIFNGTTKRPRWASRKLPSRWKIRSSPKRRALYWRVRRKRKEQIHRGVHSGSQSAAENLDAIIDGAIATTEASETVRARTMPHRRVRPNPVSN